MANDDFRMATGHISPTALNANSLYLIENFTRTTDMPLIMDWYEPTDESDIYSAFAEFVDSLDGDRGTNGEGEVTLVFPLLMPGQIQYLWEEKWLEQYSQEFTLQIPDLTLEGGWRVIWCTGLWFDVRKDAKKKGNALELVRFSFIKAQTRLYGSHFTFEFTSDFR